jgi:hypothetical protein
MTVAQLLGSSSSSESALAPTPCIALTSASAPIHSGRMLPSSPFRGIRAVSNATEKPLDWICGASVTRKTDLNPMPFWPM